MKRLRRRLIVSLFWGPLLATATGTPAATLIYCNMDSLEGWTVRTLGPAGVRIVPSQLAAACVELRSQGGSVLLSRPLPRDSVAGCRLELSWKVAWRFPGQCVNPVKKPLWAAVQSGS